MPELVQDGRPPARVQILDREGEDGRHHGALFGAGVREPAAKVLQRRSEAVLVPFLDAGVEPDELVEDGGVPGIRGAVPERDVRPEVRDVLGQVQVGPRRDLPHQGRVVAPHLVAREAGALHHPRDRRAARHAHGEDPRLRHLGRQAPDGRRVAEDHLGVQRRARTVGAEQRPVAADRDRSQPAGEVGSPQVLLARVPRAEPRPVDDRAPDVDAAGVMLGQRRDEAVVHRRQHRQVGGAVRRLGGLVVPLDHVRGAPLQVVPVAGQPLAEAEGARGGTGAAVEAGLDHRLRQTDLGRHPEAFVDRSPLAQEVAVAGGVGRHEAAARRVVHDRPDQPLERLLDGAPPVPQTPRETAAGERVGQRRFRPGAVAPPVAPGGEGHEQPPVGPAPENDVAVRNREDVPPEGEGRPERGQHLVVPGEAVASMRAERGRGGRRGPLGHDRPRRRGRDRPGQRLRVNFRDVDREDRNGQNEAGERG